MKVSGGLSRYRCTVLFCDIRGFTRFFDQTPPEETYVFVTNVLRRMSEAVEAHQGKIVNLTGDGFLAQFGDGSPSHLALEAGVIEANAISCAIRIRDELVLMNRERHTAQNFTFSVGIGINTGMVASGRVNYSGDPVHLVLGDTVNTASRIESLCKFFSVDILVSDSTAEAVQGRFQLMAMPPKELRGKVGKHRTHWVMPTSKSDPLSR